MNTTFSDIFRSSFLNNVTAVTPFDMAAAVILAVCMGFFIFLIYRGVSASVMFSPGFGITLIAMTMISAILILAVSSNITLSLGMVGALSIVRFRTAIKEPLDIAFLFWSIETGIVLAAGFIPLAVMGNVLVGIILLLIARGRSAYNPFILILKCDGKDVQAAFDFVCNQIKTLDKQKKTRGGYCEIKGWTGTEENGQVELDMEVRIAQNAIAPLMHALEQMPYGKNASMVKYNGDYMG